MKRNYPIFAKILNVMYQIVKVIIHPEQLFTIIHTMGIIMATMVIIMGTMVIIMGTMVIIIQNILLKILLIIAILHMNG